MTAKRPKEMEELKSLVKQLKLAYEGKDYNKLGHIIDDLQKFVEQNKGYRICSCRKQKKYAYHIPPIARITLEQKRKANRQMFAATRLLNAKDIDVQKQLSKLLDVPLGTNIYIGIGLSSTVKCRKGDMDKRKLKQAKCDEHETKCRK